MKKYDYLCVISHETGIVDPDSQTKYKLVNKNYLKITELMQQHKLVATQIETINYGRVNNFHEIDVTVYGVSGVIAEINQKHKSEDMPDRVDYRYTKDCINAGKYNCDLDRFSIIETKEKRFVNIIDNLRKYFEGDSI